VIGMTVRTMAAPPVPPETKPAPPPVARATLDEAKDRLIGEAQFLADRLEQTAEYDLD
jgi:hypothetical protein